MARYYIWIDDSEVRAIPEGSLGDPIEVPEDDEDEFLEFIDEEQPTLAEIEEWLRPGGR